MSDNLPEIIPSGLWQTAGGSVLRLEVLSDGRLAGSYSTIHGQPTPDEVYPLTGFHNHHLAGFVVSWGKHASLTSWCARLHREDGRLCLKSVWHLGREFADRKHQQPNEHWETFLNYTGTYFLQD